MININYGKNESLLSSCRPLEEYSWLVAQIRKNRQTMKIEQAVDSAIQDMPEDFEIREFLIGHRAEVKDLCITEYNEAETMQMIREEGREEGREKGRKEGREEGNITTLYDLYSDGDITLQRAAIKAGMSESAFLEAAKEITGI